MVYQKVPIVETARRCGLVINSRTLRRLEVEASCPFCGDHGPGKYHLSLNTDKDLYRCNLCGAHGNSISLYARIKGITNKEAFRELSGDTKLYPFPGSRSLEIRSGSRFHWNSDTPPTRICWST